MPDALAAIPRKILPPPMTTATSMSRATTEAISEARPSRIEGWMP